VPRGGKRAGAGRKAGTPNKASVARQAKVAASGLTPLDYMLTVMRDEGAGASRRDEMAKAAAPYVHPKLANIDHKSSDGSMTPQPTTIRIIAADGSGRQPSG